MHRMLFLKVTKDYSEPIVAHIASVCGLLEVELVVHDFIDLKTFHCFAESNQGFDFLYVAAHGAHNCFGEPDGESVRWADFAYVLCKSQLLNDDSVLFLGCCQGGLKKISLVLFSLCLNISSVCGPRASVSTDQVPVAIHVFLHNVLTQGLEPQYAAERTAAALGIYFPYYNRYELEPEILFMLERSAGLSEYVVSSDLIDDLSPLDDLEDS